MTYENIIQSTDENLVTKIYPNDRTKVITAKNFFNNYLQKDKFAIIRLDTVYNKYVEIMEDFGCKKPLALSGFINIIKNSGFKIDNCLSIRYPASIIGMAFRTNSNPNAIFINIKKTNLKYLGINIGKLKFDNLVNKDITVIGKNEYTNGLRNNLTSTQPIIEEEIISNDFESNKLEIEFEQKLKNADTFESDVKENDEVEQTQSSENTNANITTNTVNQIQNTEYANKNIPTNKLEIQSNSIENDANQIKIYKDWLKANIERMTAEQEYQFALYEFKLAKLKFFQQQLMDEKLNHESLSQLIVNIEQEINK